MMTPWSVDFGRCVSVLYLTAINLINIIGSHLLINFYFYFFVAVDRHFEAVEARFLRASFSAFTDILTLATKTIEEFGEGK